MIGCLRTRVRKQPIIALYFESENELKLNMLEACFWSLFTRIFFHTLCLTGEKPLTKLRIDKLLWAFAIAYAIRTKLQCIRWWLMFTFFSNNDFRLYDGPGLGTCLLMRWWGPGALAVCRARRGLPVGFLLLLCSVLFAVESLSLLYLLVVSWFVCFRRWCIGGLGVFRASRVSVCLDLHLGWWWGWRCWAGLGPPVKYFTDRSKAVLLLWIFYVFVLSCVCCVFVRVCLCVLCGRLLGGGGGGLASWPLVCGVQYEFVAFPLVSLVGCGTWLYRFLIFAPLFTLLYIVLCIWK